MLRNCLLLLLPLLCTCVSAQEMYFPPADENVWETTDLGYDPAALSELLGYLEDTDTRAFLILHRGRIVVEEYFGDFTQNDVWYWASAGKSLRATLIGEAQGRGFLDIEQPASSYLGRGWTSLTPEQEDRINVRHLLSMSSGLQLRSVDACATPDCLTYRAPPDTRWAYHQGAYVQTQAVLENAVSAPINTLTNFWVEQPIGMQTGRWIENNETGTVFWSRPRDAARFGHLILNGGNWDGAQVLSDTAFVRAMSRPSQAANPSYGYLWWLNGQESYIEAGGIVSRPGPILPSAPEDLFLAAGKNGQFICIVPSQELVVVRMGDSQGGDLTGLPYGEEIWQRMATLTATSTATAYRMNDHPVKLYPNPANRTVRIDGLGTGVADYEVVDLYGRTWSRGRLTGQLLPVAELPKGIYLLRISIGGRVSSARLVRQ